MKQTQIDKINRWCKYNALVAYVNVRFKQKFTVKSIDDDFMTPYSFLYMTYGYEW